VGLDDGDPTGTARNGILEAGEVDQTEYLCEAPPEKLVFVSSSMTNGAIGGLAAADAICQGLADTEGLPGTYMAWLGDSTGSPSTRFTQSAVPYVLPSGIQIADDWADLIDGSLDASINEDETGAGSGGLIWTGVTEDGTTSPTNTCTDWTSTAAPGAIGLSNNTGSVWTFFDFDNCSSVYRLYCFQQ